MRLSRILLIILASLSAWAVGSNISVGPAADNVNVVLSSVVQLAEAVLYIAAVITFTSSILKFRIHFQNPQQVPLSRPLAELVLGAVLVGLPFLTQLATKDIVKPPTSVLQPYIQRHKQMSH